MKDIKAPNETLMSLYLFVMKITLLIDASFHNLDLR